MKLPSLCALALSLTALTSSCLATFPNWADAPNDDASLKAAARVLDECIASYGDLYGTVGEIHSAYKNEWSSIVPQIQASLADVDFRQNSRERFVLSSGRIEQTHTGPGGTKEVLRTPETIEVSYNGEPSTDPEVLASAALVADLSSMFILGPHFVTHRQNGLRLLEPAKLDKRTHHRLIAHLAPGFGLAKDDFLVLWIDAETNRVNRVQFTMRGLESANTAHVEVTYDRFREVNGFLFPTDFVERLRYPVPGIARKWYSTELEVRRLILP